MIGRLIRDAKTMGNALFVPMSFTLDASGDISATNVTGAPLTVVKGASTFDAALIALTNELRVDYEAHRVLTAGSVHGAADSTNAATVAAATTVAGAYALLNDLKDQYEAHRVLTTSSVHGAADSTNVISAADASTPGTAITLANNLRAMYESHRVLTAGPVHGGADATNSVTLTALTLGQFRILLGRSANEPDKYYKLLTCIPTIGRATVSGYAIEWQAEDVDGTTPYVQLQVKAATSSSVTTTIAADPASCRIDCLLALQPTEAN